MGLADSLPGGLAGGRADRRVSKPQPHPSAYNSRCLRYYRCLLRERRKEKFFEGAFRRDVPPYSKDEL